ncbi:MAG: hypothetical protein IJ588_14505 [Prevotella sp.]|nr:hypothetical protein [Prevotella sp.]
MKTIKNFCALCAISMALFACEKPIFDNEDGTTPNGNVVLTFTATNSDPVTRGASVPGDSCVPSVASDQRSSAVAGSHRAPTRAATDNLALFFQKLNVMIFDAWGEKAFSQVKTQTADESGFGSLACQLQEGMYTVVAVGHSSIKSATIKSPQMVQFTASDGEKLTDTFCYAGEIEVGNEDLQQTFQMQRVAAMVQFKLTDTDVPESFTKMTIGYTGGSANFNPSTNEGTTKSTQSENRARSDTSTYQVFTFPYLAESGTLKMTLTAYDADGNTLRQRVFEQVPVTRNRITTYTGQFFDGTEGNFTQSTFGFSVNGEWGGEDNFTF